MRVLVVDDSEADRALYQAVLESHGYSVLVADGEEDIIEVCRQGHPDLVLLDGLLEGADGFAMCRALKDHPDFQRTPVLMLSGLDPDEGLQLARDAGANGFVPKAGNWKPLLVAIDQLEVS